jgi:aspartate ammonia-lyase
MRTHADFSAPTRQSGASPVRTEHDLLGEHAVPAAALYGIHTARALANFDITGDTLGRYPLLIQALAAVKQAAAAANARCGSLDPTIAGAIIDACRLVRAGEHHDQFVVDPIQGGAGTSTNMNANEVIANLALEQLGHDRGQYDIVHPLEHVNFGQSTNDVYPTAIKTALHGAVGEVLSTLRTLRQAFEDKAAELVTTVKLGRTQLQDAVPMTLGQEFNAFAGTLAKDETELVGARRQLCELNLGGTAIGTALNSHPDFRTHALAELRSITGIQELHSAADLVESTQDTGAFVHLSGTLKRTAVKLSKICNDLRLLSSGPRAGLHEIALPAVQAGSSMMPGKINPVIPEVVNQVAFEVIGNDLTVTLAAEAGQLQLNAFEPIIARSLLASTAHLTAAMRALTELCVVGITANGEHLARRARESTVTVTHLSPVLGYKLARRARRGGARRRWRRPRTSPEQRPARRSPGAADRGRGHHPRIGGPARSGASRGRSAMSKP